MKKLQEQIKAYSDYIMTANEENKYKHGWFPVCFEEFVNCEYEEEKNEER